MHAMSAGALAFSTLEHHPSLAQTNANMGSGRLVALVPLILAGCRSGTIDAADASVGTEVDGAADVCAIVPSGTPVSPGAECCGAEAHWRAEDGHDLEAICVDGHWCARYHGDLLGGNSAACPSDDYPSIGSACGNDLLSCVYACTGAGSIVANCNAGRWCGAPKPSMRCQPRVAQDAGGDSALSDAGAG